MSTRMELLHGEIPSIVNLTECLSVRNSIIKGDTDRQTCAILQMLSHLNTLLIPIPPRTDGQLKQKQNSKIVYSFQINYSYSVFQKKDSDKLPAETRKCRQNTLQNTSKKYQIRQKHNYNIENCQEASIKLQYRHILLIHHPEILLRRLI